LSNQTVKIFIIWSFNIEITTADIIDSLVVNHETAIRVFQSSMGGQDRVVWFNDGSSGLWSWVNAEFEFTLLSVINRETFHQQGTETRTSSTSERVEDQETLKTRAVVSNSANLVENLIDQFLSNGIMTTSIVVGSILLSGNHLFRMEKSAVSSGTNFINDIGFEIAVDCSWNIFSVAYLSVGVRLDLIGKSFVLPVSEKKVLKP
jgi:hypothetical protein